MQLHGLHRTAAANAWQHCGPSLGHAEERRQLLLVSNYWLQLSHYCQHQTVHGLHQHLFSHVGQYFISLNV